MSKLIDFKINLIYHIHSRQKRSNKIRIKIVQKEKIVATICFVVIIMFFFLVYPSPIGIKEKKLYWRGEKYRITTVLDYVEDQLIKFVNIFID